MDKTYNGHPSWNHWNVSLWIANDEGLYRLALDCLNLRGRRPIGNREAARTFIATLADAHVTKTPDGARYSLRTVERALAGLKD